MGKLKRLFSYSSLEVSELLVSAVLLTFAALKIYFSSSQKILRELSRLSSELKSEIQNRKKPFQITPFFRLLETADRNLGFKPSCLRRAFALLWVCRFLNIPAEFKIGIRRGDEGLDAHIWLETDGIPLETPDKVFYEIFPEISISRS